MKNKLLFAAVAASLAVVDASFACTGITLHAKDKSTVVGRTIDWSGTEMNNMYVIVPRDHTQQSLLPDGQSRGMKFTSVYGFVGLAVEEPQFVVDGTNEAGLSAGLFYFPAYGKYQPYDAANDDTSIADFQLVSWMLSRFSTIDEVKEAIKNVHVINIDSRASTVHWRITDRSGKQVILEIIDGKPTFYDSKIGVLANSPGYPWQLTNLNNYVNLAPGNAGPTKLGPITLNPFGGGSGFLGLPGDFTPPSRFVRASFLSQYALQRDTGYDSAMQAFHLLNNFDVPLGPQFPVGKAPNSMPSATQWTIVTDLRAGIIYYHTMFNRTIRSIDMNRIDFANVPFQSHPLDTVKKQTIVPVEISTVASTNTTPARSVSDIGDKVFAGRQ